MYNLNKKIISLVVAFTFLFTSITPLSIFADENDSDNDVVFEITGVSIHQVGENIPDPNDPDNNLGATRNQLSIFIDYDGPTSLYKEFNDEENKSTMRAIKIDQIRYPIYDQYNRPNFMVVSGALATWDDNDCVAGQEAIADVSQRENHRVEIYFKDGSELKYEDDDYEERDIEDEWFPGNGNENNGDDNSPSQTYTIKEIKANYNETAYDIDFNTSITNEDYSKIESIEINGTIFDMTKFKFYYGGIRFEDAAVIAKYQESENAVVNIKFKDGSIVTNEPGGNNGNEEDSTTGLASEYKFRGAVAKMEEDTFNNPPTKTYSVVVALNPAWNTDHELKEVVINNQAFEPNSLATWLPEFDYDNSIKIEGKAAYDKFKESETANIKVVFSDDSFLTGKVEGIEIEEPEEPAELSYTVEYYKDGEKFDTVEGKVTEDNNKVDAVEDKCPEGYEIDNEQSTAFPFTVTDTDNVIKVVYVKKDDNPGTEIAKDFVIEKVLMAKNSLDKDVLFVVFERELESYENNKMTSIKVNGDEYKGSDTTSFYKPDNWKKSLVIENDGIKDSFEKKTPAEIVITFTDGSISTNVANQNPAELSYTVEYYKDGEKFDTVEGKVTEDNNKVDAVEDKCPEGYEIDTDQSTALPFTVTDTDNVIKVVYVKKNDNPGTGVANKYTFDEIAIRKKWNGNQVVVVFCKEPFYHEGDVVSVTLNDVKFDEDIGANHIKKDPSKPDSIRSLVISAPNAVGVFNSQNPATVKVEFNDGSILEGTNKADNPDEGLGAPLEDGAYTLSYDAYKSGTAEESTLSYYFDERAKLVVENGKKKVSILNASSANLMLDIAVEKDGVFSTMEKKVIQEKHGVPTKVEYTFEADDLTEIQKVAVLVDAMGGGISDIGKYNKYKKADIKFLTIKEGFSNYKIIEKEQYLISQNDKNLEAGLIGSGVDTDDDGIVTPDELRNATGQPKVVYFQEPPMPNVIDLSHLHLVDISKLRDLGPKVKVLMLNGNHLKELPSDVFANATGLELILFSGNEIENLDKDLFKNNIKLKSIEFGGNNLGDVPEGIFRNNRKLEILSFMNAGVSSVPKDLIQNCPKLNSLYLNENEITSLDNDFFKGQESNMKLKEVHISDNKIENLPTSIGDVPALKELLASNNRIKSVPDELASIETLRNLDLENNDITEVPTDLYKNMIILANTKEGKNNGVRLDLSLNNLSSLPRAEMMATLNENGHRLTKFEVDRNYLRTDLTEDEKADYRALGISFTGTTTVYMPQKNLIEADVIAAKGDINLKQRFDILELYYWYLGDSVSLGNDLAKDEFQTSEEFETYLLKNGRLVNDVNITLERDKAIRKILMNKNHEWKVETSITKNNGKPVYYFAGERNKAEGIEQNYEDQNMQAGDKYVLKKTLYIKTLNKWVRALDYKTEFTARESADIQEGEKQEITVKAYKTNLDEPSMMSGSINEKGEVELKNGKYIYKINLGNEINNITASKDGQDLNATVNIVEGKYPQQLTFTTDEKIEGRINLAFHVIMMNKDMTCDLEFEYNGNPQGDGNNNGNNGNNNGNNGNNNTPNDDYSNVNFETVSVTMLEAGTDKESMANDSLNSQAKIGEKDGEYIYRVQFKPMPFGDSVGTVTEFSVDGTVIEPKTVGEYKEYEFVLDERLDKVRVGLRVDAMNNNLVYADLLFGNNSGNSGSTNEDSSNSGTDNNGGSNSKNNQTIDNSKTPLGEGEEKKVEFDDVKDGDWFKDAVDFVVAKNLFKGTAEKVFSPNMSITRGMIVTVLYRLEGEKPVEAKEVFSDVSKGAYYENAVIWASENEIVKGYGDNTFRPDAEITREELSVIFYRYKKGAEANISNLEKFEDGKLVSSWAKEGVSWACEKGILKGYNNNLNPKGTATRAEAATIIKRIIEMK